MENINTIHQNEMNSGIVAIAITEEVTNTVVTSSENGLSTNVGETIELLGKQYQVVDSFDDLKTIQELKAFLPEMDKVLYQQLKKSINKNGVIDPILYINLPDGSRLVIDGHTRLRAAIDTHQKDVPSKVVQENFESIEDIKLWMVKQQFQRRNLSNVEKLALAYQSKDLIVQQAKQNLKKGGAGETVSKPIDTDSEIAKIAGLSKSTVSRYTKVIKSGDDSLIQKLHKGEVTVRDAAKKVNESDQEVGSKPKKKASIQQEPNMPIFADSLESAQQMLQSNDIDALVIIKDENDIKMFNNSQLSVIVFFKYV